MTKKTKKSSAKKKTSKKELVRVSEKDGFKVCSFEVGGEKYKIIGKDCYQRARKIIDNQPK